MKQTNIEAELVKANITDQVISKMRQDFLVLKVEGVHDATGFAAVKNARKQARKFRIDVEKFLKELREPALAFQKAVVAKEKEISTKLEEIEDYLKTQEEIYEPKVVVPERELTDEEKVILYAKQLRAVKPPLVRSEFGQFCVKKITDGLDDLLKDYN